ncbi:hypothetical protein EDD86DRAFT_217237 [Gorgonomyces haynaldii]|nr:hypothetical protein EDD86DRAFT_217237 [Gorgonomyces haynaldii]
MASIKDLCDVKAYQIYMDPATVPVMLLSIYFSSVSGKICVQPGQTVTAIWTNAQNQNCSFTGTVGSFFGSNTVNGGEYNCNGRCGPSCNGISLFKNQYTLACYTHDICSWFYNASGGGSDPNCGAAFKKAQPDFLTWGCGQDNPSNPVQPPSSQPVCQ